MIPKKLRRTIVVNGTQYEYCVTGPYCADVFIRNPKTKEQIDWYVEGEGIKITPKDIRTIIETKQLGTVKARVTFPKHL